MSRPSTSGRSVLKCVHPHPRHPFSPYCTLTSALVSLFLLAFFPPFLQLFNHQEEYYDIPTQDLTIRQIREKLVALASTVLPAGAADQFSAALAFKSSANGGNAVTDDLKYNSALLRMVLTSKIN